MISKLDAIKLKCEFLINGIRLNELRDDLINGQNWEENRARHFLPAELQLPHEVYCQVRENPDASFRLRILENKLLVQSTNNAIVTLCNFVSAPSFASQHCQDGTPFEKIVVYNGLCNLNFTWNYYCDYFRTKEECKFCNLTPAQDFYPEENISKARKTAGQMCEVMVAAHHSHPAPKSILTRGTPHMKHGLGGIQEILEQITERFPYSNDSKKEKVIMTISPTKNIEDVKLFYDLGLHSVAFNFEVFDRGYWKAIVPGKDSFIGRDLWEASLIEAVKHFGEGRVFSALIAGLEPKKSLIEGVHWCCDHGIIPIIVPFSPETGSHFEGFRPPTFKWMMETHDEIADIIIRKLPFIATEEYWRNESPICSECFTGGFLFDLIKEKAGLTEFHGNVFAAQTQTKVFNEVE
ncbi:MAG TPA: radical SAM protein [Patescibacteria group bacterium]|nr:radical SAM protein [Patescibacteria group bacterium]